MKEVIRKIYISADGEEFNSLEECLDHEAEHCTTFPHIYTFDYNKKPVEAWKNADMFFILIRKDCPDEELKKFIDYVDEDMHYLTKGTIWAYDEAKIAYTDISALYHKIENVSDALWAQVSVEE